MSKIFQIVDGFCHWDASAGFLSAEEASTVHYDSEFVEAPDYVFEGWGYIDGEFIQPEPPENHFYDEATGTFYFDPDLQNQLENSDEFWQERVSSISFNIANLNTVLIDEVGKHLSTASTSEKNEIPMRISNAIEHGLMARGWEVGMETRPGETVWAPEKDYAYMYSGTESTVHSNPQFYPGATGVYYWSIIPHMKDGCHVFPDKSGIVIQVKADSIWWNPTKTQKYKWMGDEYLCPSNYYPGATGVHQWVVVAE